MKRYFFIIFFLLINTFLFSISGIVIDSETGIGVWGCEIKHIESGKAVRTDKNGSFNIDSENGTIVLRLKGYYSRKINLPKNLNTILKISLTPQKPVRLKKIIVKKRKIKRVSVGNLSSKQIKRTTSSLIPDTLKVVQMLPGVVTGNEISSLMFVRGGSFYEMMVLLDDLILINPYQFGGINSVFNPNLVDNVEFYSGGFPSQYGQAMSGVLDISIINGSTTNIGGFIDISPIIFDGLFECPLGNDKKSSFIIGLRRTSYDLIMGPIIDVEEGVTLPYFYDGQAKFNIAAGKDTYLNINTLVSYEGMEWKFSEDDEEQSGISSNSEFFHKNLTVLQGLRLKSKLTDKLSLKGTMGYSYQKGESSLISDDIPFHFISSRHEIQSRIDSSFIVNKNITINAGLAQLTIWNDLDYSFQTKVLIEQTNTTNAVYFETNIKYKSSNDVIAYYGTYLSSELKPLKWMMFNIGVRLEYLNLTEELVFSPKAAVNFDLSKETRIKAAAGLYTQYPAAVDYGQALNKIHGNLNLETESSIHYILGFEHDFSKNIFFKVEGFYKYYPNNVTADSILNYRNEGERRAFGFDIFIQKKISGKIDGWITYSYVNSKDRINSRNELPPEEGKYLTPVGEWFASDHDKRHNLSIVMNINFTKKHKLALIYRISSGAPYTPVTGVESYYDVVDDEMKYKPVWGKYNSKRMPIYQKLDIKLTLPFFKIKGASCFIQVSNLLSKNNVSEYYYNEDYTEKKKLKGLPLIPMFGLKFKF